MNGQCTKGEGHCNKKGEIVKIQNQTQLMVGSISLQNGFSNREARGEVVAKDFAGGGVIEPCEGGLVNVEPEGVGTEDEPEDANNDEQKMSQRKR
ncbi:hypothetical protein DM860_006068 [Cuscuta australis]|uniref:Uncharacterized protein n=1 Tax=Cuscuta australis TaxID=267555 RepID=A0A328DK39_9ASTE|nr:hypothetical protein DM860_006068 [Cuscuta australis]